MDALQQAVLRAKLAPKPPRANTLEELVRYSFNGDLEKKSVDTSALPKSTVTSEEIKGILNRIAAIEAILPQLSHSSKIPQETEIGGPEPKRILVTQIKHVVSRRYGVSINDIDAHRQDHRSVTPRHIAIYLATRLTMLSRPVIGRQFGGRDHSTVMHAEKKIAKKRERDQVFAAELAELEGLLA